MNIRPEIQHLATPIDEITTHPKNVRQGDVGAISHSLVSHGQYRPIVVQKSTGNILAGNHTYLAAKALGWSSIAATFVDCDDEQALRILLVDNRTTDLATYDNGALIDLLKDLNSTAIGLDGTAFDGNDLDQLITDLQFKDEPEQESPYSQNTRAPIYEIVGECPRFDEMLDKTKYNQLIEQINESEASDELKQFLRFAATRHLVFNYSKVAEMYPHLSEADQELFEHSALIIIDFEQAIELGFAAFESAMQQMAEEALDDE